jgi:nucleoside-diphosphate-sugar epimerase
MQTVLVTGSEGNIGRYLVAALRRRHPGWRVLRVTRGTAQTPFFDEAVLRYAGDLADPGFIERILQREPVHVVLHAASTSYSHGGYRANPVGVLDNDCRLTLNLLRHAGSFGKFVYLSSALAYERADAVELTEDLTDRIPAPTSSYGVAKYLGEQAVMLAHLQTGLRYTIWRPFNVVSPLEPTEGEGRHVFVDFFRRLYLERVEQFRVLGSGRQVRCFIWVGEAADCIAQAIDMPSTDNQVINLARREPITLIELRDLLLDIGKQIGTLPESYAPAIASAGEFAGVEMELRVPSVVKLESSTGWRSSVTVRDCMARFVRGKLDGAHGPGTVA